MRRARSVPTVCLITVMSFAGMAQGFVGVEDPCPLPTPSPPEGAGWAVVNNPDFETAFIGGVAEKWIGWKDAGLAGTVHYVGDDRAYTGYRSQKLILPQPAGDMQEAGIYQQVYVVPGETYTVTARIYLDFGTNPGDDVLGWLGVDPFGEPSGDSGGMKWATNVATLHSWVHVSVTTQAVLPVMTVSLKATRKWPWHGDGAKVYFDTVTFTGPVPTEPPPDPGVDPLDPESLIPATIGGNLISNASFEESYTGGVSAGWNKWSTTGLGQWKRSQRVGKVGGAKYDCAGEQENADMRAKTTLLVSGNPETDPAVSGTLGTSDFLKTFDYLQDSIIIGRPMVDSNYGNYYSNPTYWGASLADHCKNYEQRFPRIDCWQGWNEPDTSGNWQQVLDFSYAFTTRAHELGLKTVVLNLATGNPGNIWQMVNETYDPHCGDLLAIADYLGHHVYGWAPDEFMVTNQQQVDPCQFALRPRRFKDMYDRRGWRFPPVIATEGSTSAPWHGKYTPDQVYTDLVVMGDYMNADRWWCGYTNFVVGAMCSWPNFDLVGQFLQDGRSMAAAVGDWSLNNPADSMDGLYSQMFGAGEVHPKTTSELTPAGLFNGGINRQVSGLVPGEAYLLICWMKYEFRGYQPAQLAFYLGVDPTGQTSNGNAATIDWGINQLADKAPVHEIFSHVWRTFTPTSSTASIWLRAHHPTNNPSFKCYVDLVEVRQLDDAPPGPSIVVLPAQIDVSTTIGSNPADGSFGVRNGGPDTITYTISESCDWLSLSPTNGTSTGEIDTITIGYHTVDLEPGTYECDVTITAPEATNSPLVSPLISLTVTTVAPDLDGDGDVDSDDFGRFQRCLRGPGVTQDLPECLGARLDEDDDVDQDDYIIFQSCMGGANNPPPPGCLAQ